MSFPSSSRTCARQMVVKARPTTTIPSFSSSTRSLCISSPSHAKKPVNSLLWSSKTHLSRPARIPNPLPAIYPQRIILSDGSSFISYTTCPSPSTVRLTRDVTNNELWNTAKDGRKSDEAESGRMARFKGMFEEDDMKWMEEEAGEQEKVSAKQLGGPQKVKSGKKK